MPGFFGIISEKTKRFNKNFDITFPVLTERKEEIKRFNNAWFKRTVTEKFKNDKIFFEDNDLFICSDGLILNSKNLRNIYSAKGNFELLKKLYFNSPNSFPSELRGDFVGIICDKRKNKWIIYTNHTGSKWVFYYFDKESKSFIFGTELKMVVAGMRILGIKPELYEEGAYFLLTFGYMLGNYTLVKGVRKLPPGCTLTFQNWELESKKYFGLKNTPYIEDSEDKIVKELDVLFKEAIRVEYDKDLEYGYKHIATLSGGLDSRMNVYNARELGYKDILTITFSQSNYLDEQIAKNIASDWGFDFLFYSLDNGNYLKDIESPVLANDGLVLYFGSAHALRMQSIISWKNFGLQHNGMIGDLVLGSYLLNHFHNNVTKKIIERTAYSSKLLDKIDKSIFQQIIDKYETDEEFAFGERCINGVFNGYRVVENFSEYSSPFLHVDFLSYAFRLSPKIRYKERIYHDWISQKASEAAKYPWEATGLKIKSNKYHVLYKKGLKYIRRKIKGPNKRDSMNPINYWYNENHSLRKAFDNYYKNNIESISKYSELEKDSRFLFKEGTPREKTQVLTLLAAVKILGL